MWFYAAASAHTVFCICRAYTSVPDPSHLHLLHAVATYIITFIRRRCQLFKINFNEFCIYLTTVHTLKTAIFAKIIYVFFSILFKLFDHKESIISLRYNNKISNDSSLIIRFRYVYVHREQPGSTFCLTEFLLVKFSFRQ